MGECTYRQLQQERVQLLIGQSTLQIQEQSTLGIMQQSSLQHYSVLGGLPGVVRRCAHILAGCTLFSAEQYGVQQDFIQASTVWYRVLGGSSRRLYRANQSLHVNYWEEEFGTLTSRKLYTLFSRSMQIVRIIK